MRYIQLMFPLLGRQTLRLMLAFFLTSGIGENTALAAPPDNDNFSAATTILFPTATPTINGSTIEATPQSGEPAHTPDNPAHHSIWYQWTAPGEGTPAIISFDTLGSSFDTVLAVYTASDPLLPAVNNLTHVVSNDDNGELLTSKVFFTPIPGTTYYIAIDGFAGDLVYELNVDYGTTVLNWEAVGNIPTRTLTVDVDPAGTGTGTVTGNGTYNIGTWQEISATADPGSTLAGWSCIAVGTLPVNTTDNPLSVLMDRDKTCTAIFNLIPNPRTLTVVKTGAGTVTSTPLGINCGNDCSEIYELNTIITLTATPDADNTFVSWSGGNCTRTQECAVTLDTDITITAIFKKNFPWPMFLPAITKGVQ